MNEAVQQPVQKVIQTLLVPFVTYTGSGSCPIRLIGYKLLLFFTVPPAKRLRQHLHDVKHKTFRQHLNALKHKIHQHNIKHFIPHFALHTSHIMHCFSITKTSQLATLPVAYQNNHTKYVISHILWVKMQTSLTEGR